MRPFYCSPLVARECAQARLEAAQRRVDTKAVAEAMRDLQAATRAILAGGK